MFAKGSTAIDGLSGSGRAVDTGMGFLLLDAEHVKWLGDVLERRLAEVSDQEIDLAQVWVSTVPDGSDS